MTHMYLCGPLVIMDKRFVKILILVALGLTVTVDAQDGCTPGVRVRKNTVYKAFSKSYFNISCPVRYCEEIPTITWFKIYASNTNDYIPVTETEQITITQERSTAHQKEIISYLSFKSISNNDAELYKCVAAELNYISESHSINVSVSDTILEPANTTVSPHILTYSSGGMPYIILACYAFLILAAILILISFLSVRRCTCKGTPIKNTAEFTTAVFSPVTPTPTLSEHEDDLTV